MPDSIEQTGSDVSMGAQVPIAPLAGLAGTAIGGPLVGAAGSIAGGLISNLFNKSQSSKALDFQRDMALHGISYRVADAKAAGLHPLFALGANIPIPQPMVLGDRLGEEVSKAGQVVGRGIADMETVAQKSAAFAAYNESIARARQDDAIASYYNAMTSKLQQDTVASPLGPHQEGQATGGPMSSQQPAVPGGSVGNPGSEEGWYNLKAVDQPSAKSGMPAVQSGVYPGHQFIQIREGLPVLFPALEGESWSEHWNEMSYKDQLGLINRNARIFGPGWVRDFTDYMLKGTTPSHYYAVPKGRVPDKPEGSFLQKWWRPSYEPYKK